MDCHDNRRAAKRSRLGGGRTPKIVNDCLSASNEVQPNCPNHTDTECFVQALRRWVIPSAKPPSHGRGKANESCQRFLQPPSSHAVGANSSFLLHSLCSHQLCSDPMPWEKGVRAATECNGLLISCTDPTCLSANLGLERRYINKYPCT